MEMSLDLLNNELKKLNGAFDVIDQTALLRDLEQLRKKNRDLEQLLEDVSILVTQKTIPLMLDYVISILLDKFIPTYLCFMMDKPRGTKVSQYFYENLKLVQDRISSDSYIKLKKYLSDSSSMISYKDLKKQGWEDSKVESINPEYFMPMSGIGGVYGVVILGAKVLGDEYSEFEKLYLDKVIHFLSVSIQNGLHHQTSITDSKTGLYNHEYFLRRLSEEIASCNRRGFSSALAIIDVDFFKHFNDSYGHVAGDVALETLANFLKSTMRAEDAVARFGGEEFCLLITNCDKNTVKEVTERVRSGVEKMSILYNNNQYSITISMGVRIIDKDESQDANKLMEDVDKALYVSKIEGRNRVTLFRTGFLGRARLARAASARK